jgi:glycosyltransferase involved in cell wall biosynthesis
MRKLHGEIPIYFRGDSTLVNPSPMWKRTLRRLALRWVYSHADVAFSVGTNSSEYFREMGFKNDSIVFAPHAIDNERFSRHDHDRRQEANSRRAELGIAGDAPVILFAGKLSPVKSPGMILEAFRRVPEQLGAHLVFLGSGPLEEELRNSAPARTHFLGFQNQSDLPVAYRIGDVMVLYSVSETWGLGVNEAMACGLPACVSDRVGCAPDLIGATGLGWVAPYGSIDDLAETFTRICTAGREELNRVGVQAMRAIQDWSFEVQVDRVRQRLLSDLR